MLCQALVDTSGNVTVTDEREYTGYGVDDSTIEVTDGALNVKALGIDTGQLAANSVTDAKLEKERVQIKVLPSTQLWSTGDGKFKFTVTDDRLDGSDLTAVDLT